MTNRLPPQVPDEAEMKRADRIMFEVAEAIEKTMATELPKLMARHNVERDLAYAAVNKALIALGTGRLAIVEGGWTQEEANKLCGRTINFVADEVYGDGRMN